MNLLTMNRRKYFLIGLIFVVVFTGVFALFFKRDQILWTVIEKKIEKFERNTAAKVSVRSFAMEGLGKMNVSDVVVLTPEKDTFVVVHNASVKFSISQLLRFSTHIDELELSGVRLYPNDQYGRKKYEFLRSNHAEVKDTTDLPANKLSSFLHNYKKVLELLPNSLSFSDVLVVGYKDGNLIRASFPETFLRDGRLESQVMYRLTEQNKSVLEKCFILSGNINDLTEATSSFKIYPGNVNSMPITLKKGDESLSFSFDTLFFSCKTDEEYEHWSGDLSVSSLGIDYARLASLPIQIDTCSLRYNLSFSLEPYDRVELDSNSVISFNGFELNPYFLYEKSDSLPRIYFHAKKDDFEAQRLFDALPINVFPHVEGIKTKGNLAYACTFDLDFHKTDSVRFSSSMTKKDFAIDSYGKIDFRSVGQPFTYHVFENGVEETSFVVGPENPDFTPIQEISPYLRHAVLYSEDGLFYSHKGFLETAMNAAIAKDIQEKRFARGGSTISMQLVKNLWLSREKTLSRKVEEAIIVWMVENNRLLSKDRMYEIYLNIIEWGPHIYGVRQASHFYFAKEPSELTPEEAIFMASVIPRPKKFMWFFDENHDLKPFLTAYFDVLGDKLLRHNIITQQQRDELTHNVVISGAAKAYLRHSVKELDDEGEDDDESALINVLDKAMRNEDIPNRTNKTN